MEAPAVPASTSVPAGASLGSGVMPTRRMAFSSAFSGPPRQTATPSWTPMACPPTAGAALPVGTRRRP
eukprot:1287732-Alexandrium_andersonii.AAC.1